jgi:raffinose/stachyose/melibiose transport system permease protein
MTAEAEVRVAAKPPQPRRRPRLNAAQRSSPVAYVVLTLLALFAAGPMVIFVFSALKTQTQLGTNPLGWPSHAQWHNFVDAWTQANMGAGLRNSLIIVAGTVAGVCVIAGCAAYAMARLQLPGANLVMLYLIVSSALPIQLFLVPLFYLWTRLNLYDSLFGLIIIYWAIFAPFATLLLRSFLVQLPPDYEQAARIDGAGEITILTRIVLPLAWPGVLTIALVTALGAYNEFLLAVTFVQSTDKMPISTTFYSFQQGYTVNYTLISAAGIIMLVPMVALFLVLQRRFISGLVSSGLGG